MSEIQRGDRLSVNAADGTTRELRALGGVIAGGDFAVVWACTEAVCSNCGRIVLRRSQAEHGPIARSGASIPWNPWKWSASGLVAGIVVAAAADFGALIVALATGLAENCDNGISRWECSDFL